MTPPLPLRHGQTKALLGVGFGGLLLLLCVLGASSVSFLHQIEVRHETIRQDYLQRGRMLEKLRTSIYISGTYFRDFVLDTGYADAAGHRKQFLTAESDVLSRVADYERIARPAERKPFQDLRNELKAYFDALDPALSWSAPERQARSYVVIREQLLPRRSVAIGLVDRVQQRGEEQLEVSSQAVSDMFLSFRLRLLGLLVLAVTIGISLAAITMWRLLNLERISEANFHEAIDTREKLKQLSAELVSAQEDERRRISRELHDEVGQVLSAMMLGLGNLRSSLDREANAEAALRQLRLIEDMTERSARVVRNLSLVLRPTMLDDLGLVAALKWLAREISRNSSLQVDVVAEDTPDDLPEEHRTCVYRIVQEALRNTSRHSGARHARITIEPAPARLRIVVQDDGKGFNPESEKGMGILGMEERVARLGGWFQIDAGVGRGAKVIFELPLPEAMGTVQETRPFLTA